MALFSRRGPLNPYADPFLYQTPFDPPSKVEFASVPLPIFNLAHPSPFWKTVITQTQPRQLPMAMSRVVWGSPVHEYGSYVEPTSRWEYQYPMFGFYDVDSQVWWPGSSGFGGVVSQPENSVGNGQMKVGSELRGVSNTSPSNSERKCTIGKWTPQEMSGVHDAIRRSPTAGDVMPSETTTVMIKNIPNQFRRHHLLAILDDHCKLENRRSSDNIHNSSFGCRRSEYDFVYLPMDFRRFWYDGKISNLGYAFVNFTSATAASEFCKVFHRRQWEVVVNKKVCEIKRARIQGSKVLKEAFRNKIFWCPSNQYLPVMLEPPSDGCRSYRANPIGKRIARPPPNPMKKCG